MRDMGRKAGRPMNRLERYLTEGLTLANLPTCGDPDQSGWLLWFGEGYGQPYYVLVGERHLEDALDEAVDHLAEHAPELLADEQVKEEYDRLVEEGNPEEEAQEEAEIDTICAGDCGHYVASDGWGYSAEPVGRLHWKATDSERAESARSVTRRRLRIIYCRLTDWYHRHLLEQRAKAAGLEI